MFSFAVEASFLSRFFIYFLALLLQSRNEGMSEVAYVYLLLLFEFHIDSPGVDERRDGDFLSSAFCLYMIHVLGGLVHGLACSRLGNMVYCNHWTSWLI